MDEVQNCRFQVKAIYYIYVIPAQTKAAANGLCENVSNKRSSEACEADEQYAKIRALGLAAAVLRGGFGGRQDTPPIKKSLFFFRNLLCKKKLNKKTRMSSALHILDILVRIDTSLFIRLIRQNVTY